LLQIVNIADQSLQLCSKSNTYSEKRFFRQTVRVPCRNPTQSFIGGHRFKALPEEMEKIGRRDHLFVQEDYVILHTTTVA